LKLVIGEYLTKYERELKGQRTTLKLQEIQGRMIKLL
jgi:hypothetical protein